MDVAIKLLTFYKMSLYLDFIFLISNQFLLKDRLLFIAKKYLIIFLHLFNLKKFEISKSHIRVLELDYYYDSPFGLASLQGMLSNHKRMLDSIANDNLEVIFDIGANVGAFTILSHFLLKPKNIYSFEPIDNVFNCLKKNTKNFKEVIINKLALSNESGNFYMSFDSDNSSISTFIKDKNGIEVKTITLKEFVKNNKIKKIDLLKIDVESFENLVLEGSGDFLKNVRYLFIEVTIKDNKNYTISSLFSMLYGEGYNFQLVSYRNASDKSFGEIPWMDCLLKNIDYKN